MVVHDSSGRQQKMTMVDLDTLPMWLASIDARNRLRACEDAGIEPTFVTFEGTAGEAASRVESLNLHRRHLTAEFRDQRIRERRANGEDYRQIAKAEKVSVHTIAKAVRAGVADSNTCPSEPAPPTPTTPPAEPDNLFTPGDDTPAVNDEADDEAECDIWAQRLTGCRNFWPSEYSDRYRFIFM